MRLNAFLAGYVVALLVQKFAEFLIEWLNEDAVVVIDHGRTENGTGSPMETERVTEVLSHE